jgi:hypothetical protein
VRSSGNVSGACTLRRGRGERRDHAYATLEVLVPNELVTMQSRPARLAS